MKAESGRRMAEGFAPHSRDLTGRRTDRQIDRRNAMTLFELLLVLALLVVVGSLAAPLYEGSFSSIRLRRGTDQVLAAWSQSRTHAIEAGRIYQFRFKPEGNAYRVDRWAGGLEIDQIETNTPGNSETLDPSENRTLAEIEFANWNLSETLPEEIAFSSSESVREDEMGERTMTRLDQESDTEWSSPILFYPDGTTSDASLLLKSKKGLYRRATLRALTGVARASELLSQEEVDQLSSR